VTAFKRHGKSRSSLSGNLSLHVLCRLLQLRLNSSPFTCIRIAASAGSMEPDNEYSLDIDRRLDDDLLRNVLR